jgi:hypothetical protein
LQDKLYKEKIKEKEQARKNHSCDDNDEQSSQDHNEEEEHENSSQGEKENPSSWQTEQFYALPENVQNAINNAKLKKKHTDFYYRLRLLNDKIHVFTKIFYNRVPLYQKKWYEKKRADLENKL